MRKIDVSQIVDPNIQQPVTGLSLDFLQTGTKQMIFALCWNIIKSKGLSYNNNTPYYIASTANAGFTSDGVVFYGGELYIMTENTAGLQYAVIDTTPDATADPLLFSDNVSRNVHNNRYLSYSASATGALFDTNNIVNCAMVYPLVPAVLNITSMLNSWVVDRTINAVLYNGTVSLEGAARKATVTTGVMFNLPVGYRPSVTKILQIIMLQGSSYVNNYLVVAPGGDVYLDATPSSATTFVELDGITFRL